MAVYLHPTFRKPIRKPEPEFQPDAAARLSAADCAVIAGDDKLETERMATRLLYVFGVACFLVLMLIAFMPRA